ncbi:MAG: alpha/beta hydrolase [Clostridiales bacterium]|nr:alpha/beta hydrolase [Clostridiales bacterium]
MFYEYKGSKVNYNIIGNGEVQFVFLHGWGGSVKSFDFICKYLNINFTALFIDFPPFGNSESPKQDYTIFDYAELTLAIMRENNFNKPIIVGHSFGGRVAIILAAGNYAKKLVLVNSAGLKPKRNLKYYFRVIKNKVYKKLHIKKQLGSKDYIALSNNMKKTFVNIVTTFLDKYVININVPTLIFWGKQDKETPVYMAKRFNKLIKNSQLVIVKKAGHFSYINDFNTFLNVLNYFVVN